MNMPNMNSGLDKIRVIDRAALSGKLYFQSLLEQAYSKEILSENEIERMQYECIELLAYKTERYHHGDSSSIRVEKAQSIMASNLFTIGLWLKTYPNPDDAVIALQNESINELYQKGRKRIDTMLTARNIIHKKLLGQLLETKNVFYRSSFEDGIKGFFKLYDADFEAQEIHITADYPVYNHIPELAGIEFIKAYLNAMYCENQLCGYFSADDIHHLLCGYSEDYEGLLMNIYEPVLLTAIGCIIAGTDLYRLDITEAGARFLHQTFAWRSKREIMALISKTTGELTRRFQFSQWLTEYIQDSLPLITDAIDLAAREHTLNRIFFTPAYPENNPKIIFSWGEKMDDKQYRKVIEEIGQCRFSQDKVTIIKENIHSLADLEDALLDADLAREETQAVLRELALPEIAALSKKYQLQADIDSFALREQERSLRENLQRFVSGLPSMQQEFIVRASKAMSF